MREKTPSPTTICALCLDPSSARKEADKKGKPYLICDLCGARTFLRREAPGVEFARMIVERLGGARFSYLFRAYDPNLVLRIIAAQLDAADTLDDRMRQSVHRALEDLTRGSSTGTQADLSRVLEQMDEVDWTEG